MNAEKEQLMRRFIKDVQPLVILAYYKLENPPPPNKTFVIVIEDDDAPPAIWVGEEEELRELLPRFDSGFPEYAAKLFDTKPQGLARMAIIGRHGWARARLQVRPGACA